MPIDVYEVVKKLVGPIRPVGESSTDEERFENLKVMTDLVDMLLIDIDRVAMAKNHCMHSMSKSGKFADEFLTRIGVVE